MKIFIAGVGPGHVDYITIAALNAAKDSDLIIIPRSNMNNSGMAEHVISQLMPGREIIPLYCPMIKDEAKRDKIILEQLEKFALNESQKIFFPVIGDSVLYSTGAYFIKSIKKLFTCEINFIPGISAHSLASSIAKRFLAMKDEIFSVIPGTADSDKIKSALETCGSAAIYKPSAITDTKFLLEISRKWEVIRVDYAGIPEHEKILTGSDALNNLNNYMSIILLYRE
ncbi:MAG: precorrin-2 C(20)-methyltransferase [Synergistaceae bacterium]|nr:precorrin-2 C(20)-methyltransferase [Synergistaceae bacterium]